LDELRALREAIRALPRHTLSRDGSGRSFAVRVLQQAERTMLTQGAAAASLSPPADGDVAPPRRAGEPASTESAVQPAAANHQPPAAAAPARTAREQARHDAADSGADRRVGSLGDGNHWKRLIA